MKESVQERVRLAQIRSGATPEVSFTKLDLPTLITFETAVTFDRRCDPLTAHNELFQVFGQPAGSGRFLFCADSALPGRFWVRSVVPWVAPPASAISALDPKRIATQLATGLMYHFSLSVCVGEVSVVDGRKHVRPYQFSAQWENWFTKNGEEFGIRPLMVSVMQRNLRFEHEGAAFRIDFAVLEGALEVADTDRLIRRLLRGFGSHRRLGLGMLKLQS
jgi:CRISPR-associated protein Cas6/Cse3/CasE subtype I-E